MGYPFRSSTWTAMSRILFISRPLEQPARSRLILQCLRAGLQGAGIYAAQRLLHEFIGGVLTVNCVHPLGLLGNGSRGPFHRQRWRQR